MIAYKSISGTPPTIKQVEAEWGLTSNGDSTGLVLNFKAEMKGLGYILAPIVKMKLSKVGDELLEELKYYVENGKPHPRKTSNS
ncbi:MAG: hypothetical protein ACI9JN_000356 [Bacteroidia bacterium]